MILKAGDPAPKFQLPDQDGKNISLEHFRGKKVLLFFYPKAGTSGWTTQARSLEDARGYLEQLKVTVVGISRDLPSAQKKFADKNNLTFPLLSDPDHAVADQYGVWGSKTMYGKKVEGIIRSSFLIDEKGKISTAWYKISPADTVPQALKVLS
jgi:peroxiredoxin Q/BCP